MPTDATTPGARLVVVALCLMVCAVPLVLPSGVYEPIFSPKWFALHSCLTLACLGWLLQTRWGRDVRLALSPALLPALCWMGAALLSSPATTHALDTLVELLNQASLIALFVVASSALSLKDFRPVLWTGAVTGLAVALIGILQYHDLASPIEGFIGVLRNRGVSFFDISSAAPPSATFVNRNFAAEYLVCAIPLSGLLFFTSRSRAAFLLSGLSASLMGVFLVYTRTRAAWVGLAGTLIGVGGLLTLWPGLRRPILEAFRSSLDRPGRWIGMGFLALFVILSGLPPYRLVLPETKAGAVSTASSLLNEEGLRDASVTERLAFWRNSLHLMADHPLLGVGPGGWKRAYPPYDKGATITSEYSVRWPHNDYVEIASEYGLVGLGVYLWFLSAALRCLLTMAQTPDPLSRLAAPLLAIALLALLGDAFFAFPKAQPQAAMLMYLTMGIAGGAAADKREKRALIKVKGGSAPAPSSLAVAHGGIVFRLVPFLLLLVSLSALETSRRRTEFDRHYLGALQAGQARENWPVLLREVQKALEYGTFRPHILTFEGIALQNLGRYSEAEAAYRQALTYTPHAWRAHSGLGSVSIQQGRLDEALNHCETALSLCPDALDVRGNLAMISQGKGDFVRAEREIRAVIRINPRDARSHHYLGNLFSARGSLDSAAASYERALRLTPLPQTHANLADIYRAQGRLRDALPHYREAFKAHPENPDVLWGLGLALEDSGQGQQAEGLYRRAIALRPDFPQAHFALGNLSYARRRYQEALTHYRTFLNLWRGDPSYTRFAQEQTVRCEEKSSK